MTENYKGVKILQRLTILFCKVKDSIVSRKKQNPGTL